ncbi:hypothetical protein BED47_14325 [Gottfriedia luciferensis]|uniref:Uncharacterized protein n=1 Tax=Gottfriedia luciferensis TaxID=178774 RepID=A0ABX2ZKV9_9BACI|nr:hypothetical protein BED47_14325 [Gottfriedia luciferensis]
MGNFFNINAVNSFSEIEIFEKIFTNLNKVVSLNNTMETVVIILAIAPYLFIQNKDSRVLIFGTASVFVFFINI